MMAVKSVETHSRGCHAQGVAAGREGAVSSLD